MSSIKAQVALLAAVLAAPVFGDALANVPAASNYFLVYQLAIPGSNPNFNSSGVPYSVNNSSLVANGSFERIAYYLELQTGAGSPQWIWLSMQAFTSDATKIGVPTVASGEFYQQDVLDLDIDSNVVGIVTGTGINSGHMEFWPSNYGTANNASVPNASGSTYDWGDGGSNTSTGYGSMQIANYGASQMLLSYNNWNAGGTSDLGIGNAASGNPDWTFAGNAGGYSVRSLQVFVSSPVPEPSPALFFGSGLLLLCAGRAVRLRRSGSK